MLAPHSASIMTTIHKYNIFGNEINLNINVALDIIVNKIPSFSGIHLLGFKTWNDGIDDEILYKIKTSCENNNLCFKDERFIDPKVDYWNDDTDWDTLNKNIVYIVSRDFINLDYLDIDQYLINIYYINNLSDRFYTRNKHFEMYIKYNIGYYNNDILYNYNEYNTEELTNEFKKKL